MAANTYRVIAVGVGYTVPDTIQVGEGDVEIQVRKDAHKGDLIELTDREARRLQDLGAVVPADEDPTLGEMSLEALQAEADRRGLQVDGTGANGTVLEEDLLAALEADDANGQPPADPDQPFDASQASDEDIDGWLRDSKPNVDDTVAAAQGDPQLAQRLLDAENRVSGDQPRKGVQDGLAGLLEPGE